MRLALRAYRSTCITSRAATTVWCFWTNWPLSQMTVDVQPRTSILDALIAADVFVSYDCKRGECGVLVSVRFKTYLTCAALPVQGASDPDALFVRMTKQFRRRVGLSDKNRLRKCAMPRVNFDTLAQTMTPKRIRLQ